MNEVPLLLLRNARPTNYIIIHLNTFFSGLSSPDTLFLSMTLLVHTENSTIAMTFCTDIHGAQG